MNSSQTRKDNWGGESVNESEQKVCLACVCASDLAARSCVGAVSVTGEKTNGTHTGAARGTALRSDEALRASSCALNPPQVAAFLHRGRTPVHVHNRACTRPHPVSIRL